MDEVSIEMYHQIQRDEVKCCTKRKCQSPSLDMSECFLKALNPIQTWILRNLSIQIQISTHGLIIVYIRRLSVEFAFWLYVYFKVHFYVDCL